MLGRQRPRGLSIRVALCAFIAALSGACKSSDPRTQVMLVIEADDEVRARATELVVAFESRSEFDHIDGAPYEQTFPTVEGSEPTWPYSIALVPRGNDARRSYRVTATLYEGGMPIARLRARSGFVAQRTLELKLLFSAACLDEKSLSCSDQETCYDGECWSSDINVNTLPALGSDGSVTAADGGMTTSSETRTGSQRRSDGGTAGGGGSSGPGRRGAGGASGNDAADGGTTDKPARVIGGNCGDGVWNDEEECDTAIPQGMPGACPEVCTATDGCKPLQKEGAACKTRCMEYPVQSAIADDGCCLPGTDPNIDPDCATVAMCGNGVREMGELCDGDCPTDLAACPRSNECQRAEIIGDAASCSAQCVMLDVEICMTGDGCCGTSGCTNETDGECSPGCGNGVVEPALGELCEPTSADQPCRSCDDGDPCTDDITTGTPENCNVRCDHPAVTRTVNGDGCCPPGRGNANNDSDCSAMCGNNVVERGEFCDGLCPTQEAQCEDLILCTRDVLVASPCGMRCSFEPILGAANGDSCCPFGADATTDNDCGPSCGNLVVERGEMCDGNCPTSCLADTDNNACTANVVVSTGCQRRCESRPVAANTNGRDGCCPSTANSNTDSDCQPTCTGDQVLCGRSCVQLNTNAHCSGCNAACPATQMCLNSTCVDRPPGCDAPNMMCGNSCVDLGTDEHCGSCAACMATQRCVNGSCQDREPVCTGGTILCSGACVTPNTDDHCVGCTPCMGDQQCVGGTCRTPDPVCNGGTILCSGACVTPNTDDHCGTCAGCRSGETCTGTLCQPVCTNPCGAACCAANEDCGTTGCEPRTD